MFKVGDIIKTANNIFRINEYIIEPESYDVTDLKTHLSYHIHEAYFQDGLLLTNLNKLEKIIYGVEDME